MVPLVLFDSLGVEQNSGGHLQTHARESERVQREREGEREKELVHEEE